MRQAIGIDVGGTGIRGARVAASGDVLEYLGEPTAGSPQAVVAQIDDLIAKLDAGGVEAIGIGAPSRVDFKTARISPGGYIDLSGRPLAGRLGGPRGRPVVCHNDATMALVAEARVGAARGCADVVLLTIGTGIGGAALLDGKIVHGKGTAGQLGHITVIHDGLPCACGRKGCLETMSSGTSLGRHIAEAGFAPDTKAEDLLARNDDAARAVIALWLGPLRSGIDSLVACFDPEMLVLGGGLGETACRGLAGFPPVSDWFGTNIVSASLGSKAGVIGAALAALDHIP
jgi:glucokinase